MSQKPFDPFDLSPRLQHALQLITALCDERITPEQFQELDSLVCTDGEIRRFYVDMMHLDAGLYYFASAIPDMDLSDRVSPTELDDSHLLGMGETMMLPAVRDSDPPVEAEEVSLPSPVLYSKPVEKSKWRHMKGGIAALITIGLSLLAYFVPQIGHHSVDDYSAANPRPPWFVAWTDLTANPVWETAPQHQTSFAVGDSLMLRSGVVQLKLRHDGRLVVEGPAEVSFISDAELRVNRGRIVATFPGGGLTVLCPSGSIYDLGTQFGVAVDLNTGSTQVEVFEGRVSASLSSNATTQPTTPLLLTVGQAAEMRETSLRKTPEGAIPQRFICNLQSDQVTSLDVTDLVSGGDGTTRRRGIAVDSTSGNIGVLPLQYIRNGDHKYHLVSGFPVVNGAFVPDGSTGPVTVDSGGHLFQFPSTTSQTTNLIWTGGAIPWPDNAGILTTANGIDYSTPEHAIICTHANNALTLDLDAVRRLWG